MSRSARFLFSTVPLICIDMLSATFCFLAAYMIRFNAPLLSAQWIKGSKEFQPYLHLMVFVPFIRALSYNLFGIYNARRRDSRSANDTFSLLKAVSVGTGIVIIVAFLYRGVFQFREYSYSRLVFILDWTMNLFVVTGVHSIVRGLRDELIRRGVGVRRIAVQGTGEVGRAMVGEIQRSPEIGYEVAGYVDDGPEQTPVKVGNRTFEVVGSTLDILDVINRHRLDEIVLTNPAALGDRFMEFVEACDKVDVVVKIVPDLYGILLHKRAIENLAGLLVIQANEITLGGFARVLKRAEDIILAAGVLTVLSPVLALAALMIKLDTPGPVLFKQDRAGKNGRVFTMYKFRSMAREANEKRKALEPLNVSDGPLFKMKDDPRITRVGKILRRTSIDELPQLFNVLKGQMSLVGPRPLPVADLERHREWEQRRYSAIPGITGLWQVNRSVHTPDEMLKWDTYYIENWSIWLDLKILVKTIGVVLTGKGAY